ncbi:hypothetical protein [Nitrosopumilus sp.]|uniref:hypothetical protein n=1 Tax=Nitrosopumilus sp. TaxID=2024843 RepID=UPI002931A87A|nr:hypothetical protein [Nitrosopumilus sp.]
MNSLTKSYFHKGDYSSTQWTRENKISDFEITDLLCEEIKMILHDSRVLDKQYKLIIKYYQRLTHESFA